MSDKIISAKVDAIADRLISLGHRLATAESCTGGLIAKCLTDAAGSSAWFDRSYITYSNEAKHEMLDVRNTTLSEHGAVSEEVVSAMARAATSKKVQWSIAVSGIAGPGGGTDEKPVGTVWIAWVSPIEVFTEKCLFSGDRESIRQQTVVHSLAVLSEILENHR